jgi:hypothetical protein
VFTGPMSLDARDDDYVRYDDTTDPAVSNRTWYLRQLAPWITGFGLVVVLKLISR